MTAKEKSFLRELAKKQREYANKPIMQERARLWKLHNLLKGERPMVVMEEGTFLGEILPRLQCESLPARQIESQLLHNICIHELIGDDKVIPDTFKIGIYMGAKFLGVSPQKTYAEDGVGYHIDPVIHNLEDDMHILSASEFFYDKDGVLAFTDVVNDTIGDILPVQHENDYNRWGFCMTQKVVDLMGMDNMFCAMMTEPETFHKLMRMITDELIKSLRWQEENGLLKLNNQNDYMGSGSFCFTDELPQSDFNGYVRSIDTWGHINSQESVGMSPKMFHEMLYPYYEEMAAQFGLVYYGCCEPVHEYWDSLCNLPNLRKISISSWCDEQLMAERLYGGSVIYSRKPSANFLGVNKELDEPAFTENIKTTANLVKNFKAEIIFRDIYKLSGNIGKIKRAVEITRELTEDIY